MPAGFSQRRYRLITMPKAGEPLPPSLIAPRLPPRRHATPLLPTMVGKVSSCYAASYYFHAAAEYQPPRCLVAYALYRAPGGWARRLVLLCHERATMIMVEDEAVIAPGEIRCCLLMAMAIRCWRTYYSHMARCRCCCQHC